MISFSFVAKEIILFTNSTGFGVANKLSSKSSFIGFFASSLLPTSEYNQIDLGVTPSFISDKYFFILGTASPFVPNQIRFSLSAFFKASKEYLGKVPEGG